MSELVTRKERYLAKISGENVTLPEKPITREEMYLAKIAEGTPGGETVDTYTKTEIDEKIETVNSEITAIGEKITTANEKIQEIETKVEETETSVAGNTKAIAGLSKETKDEEAIIKATLGYEQKNLIVLLEKGATVSGITYTLSPKTGIVTANGTVSSDKNFGYVNASEPICLNKNTEYSARLTTAIPSDFIIRLCDANNSNAILIDFAADGSVKKYTADKNYTNAVIFLYAKSGVSIDSFSTQPILEVASKSNGENSIGIPSVNSRITNLENLLPFCYNGDYTSPDIKEMSTSGFYRFHGGAKNYPASNNKTDYGIIAIFNTNKEYITKIIFSFAGNPPHVYISMTPHNTSASDWYYLTLTTAPIPETSSDPTEEEEPSYE